MAPAKITGSTALQSGEALLNFSFSESEKPQNVVAMITIVASPALVVIVVDIYKNLSSLTIVGRQRLSEVGFS